MDLENLWYESSPFVYLLGGLFTFLSPPGSILLKISGVLLLVAAATILRLRWRYRKALYRDVPDAITALRTSSSDGRPKS